MTKKVLDVNELSRSRLSVRSFYSHLRCLSCFIRNEILINFVGKKEIVFLLRILYRKPSSLKKILTD